MEFKLTTVSFIKCYIYVSQEVLSILRTNYVMIMYFVRV